MEAMKKPSSSSCILSDPTGTDLGASYELGQELGRGGFGVTYLCTEKSTGTKYACKSISKELLSGSEDVVRTEVAIMRHLPKHPNIIALKDTFEDNKSVHLVMEPCHGGELFDRIYARGFYAERDAAVIAKTILQVVKWCHKHGVMHRDLKPENILFANKDDNAPLKIIDFGLSAFFLPGQQFKKTIGTVYYMAPELLKGRYGPEIDIWSSGVIIYFLLTGFYPFSEDCKEGVYVAIARSMIDFSSDPWPTVSAQAKDLVKRMLARDPKKRLTAEEALDHPWLRNVKVAPEVSVVESSCPMFNLQKVKCQGAQEPERMKKNRKGGYSI